MKALLLLMAFFQLSNVYTQTNVNINLRTICDSIKTLEDNTDINFEHLARSRTYQIEITGDTLSIEVEGVDKHISSEDPRDTRPVIDVYKMNVNDIADIEFTIDTNQVYDYSWTEAQLEITALREYPLFKHTYKGVVLERGAVRVPVINLKDTIHFRQLAQLLNNHIDIGSNYTPPNCKAEEFTVNRKTQEKVYAVDINNLNKPISLNGSLDLESEFRRILMDYLIQENIKKLFGSVVVDESNQFKYFDSYQNDMYNYLNSLDTINAGYRVLRETGYLKITDEQKEQIVSIFKKQNWTSGRCNEEQVMSYVDFFVENKEYKKS